MRYLFGARRREWSGRGRILAPTSPSGTTAWYLTDKLGSVREIVNTTGAVQDQIVYDSFGNIMTENERDQRGSFQVRGDAV